MSKYFVAVFLTALLVFCSFAYAEENEDLWECPATGYDMKVPEKFLDSPGMMFADDSGEIEEGSGIFYSSIVYVCRSLDEAEAFIKVLESKADSADEDEVIALLTEFYEPAISLFNIFVIDANRKLEDLSKQLEYYAGEPYTFDFADEIGTVGEYTFYLTGDGLEENEKFLTSLNVDKSYLEDIKTLYKDHASYLSAFSLHEPAIPETKVEETGRIADFKTKDLDGNSVNSLDLFAANKVTMVNIWATWCPPCKAELPELGEIAKRIEANGCAIIGICLDAEDEAGIKTAKDLLKDAGAEYLVLTPTADIDSLFPADAIPTTYFVLQDGTILGNPVVGAQVNAYEKRIEKILAEQGK